MFIGPAYKNLVFKKIYLIMICKIYFIYFYMLNVEHRRGEIIYDYAVWYFISSMIGFCNIVLYLQ
jgi:hypothetical protein